jgi:hypothetical protein
MHGRKLLIAGRFNNVRGAEKILLEAGQLSNQSLELTEIISASSCHRLTSLKKGDKFCSLAARSEAIRLSSTHGYATIESLCARISARICSTRPRAEAHCVRGEGYRCLAYIERIGRPQGD